VWMGRPSTTSTSPDYLETWQGSSQIQTDTVTLADFDFRLHYPGARLSVRRHVEVEAKCPGLAIYDYPGKLVLAENQEDPPDDADSDENRETRERPAETRLEEERCQAERYQGQGSARWLATGSCFQLPMLRPMRSGSFWRRGPRSRCAIHCSGRATIRRKSLAQSQ